MRRLAMIAVLLTPAIVVAADGGGDRSLCPVAAANLFKARSWLPPPPLPPKPPPPKAPPLPFVYLGQMEEGGRIALFLGRAQGTLIVRAGDGIDGLYRVEEVLPTRATFVYLPLNEQQQLTLRSRP
jgi:hypothetical protein